MKFFGFKRQFIFLLITGLVIALVSILPLRLAIARYQVPNPQAILTLGGGRDREVFTAQFAQIHPSLPIWVSAGSPTEIIRQTFRDAGIDETRLHIDRRAVDTVTNFTTLVRDFNRKDIKHLYLITSDDHMPRAKAIATVVLGSQGITFTPVTVSSKGTAESKLRILRDTSRALMWVITGRTGASLKDFNNAFEQLNG
jgi:uncharacterized SAM-binding protein YcdF (DUF218 family)